MGSVRTTGIIIFIVLAALSVYFLTLPKQLPQVSPEDSHLVRKNAEITIGTVHLSAEIVRTPEELRRGLSGRENLPPDTGMFFDFGSENHWGIWMKDMKFPIDIIWFDKNMKIVTIAERVLPMTYPKVFYPDYDAAFVLELPSGTVEKYGFEVGDSAFVL